jgi:hypothetical protein
LAAWVFFAGVLVALFTAAPFLATVFDPPLLTSCAFAEIFPFCAFVAFALRVVFAISLHHFGRDGRVL